MSRETFAKQFQAHLAERFTQGFQSWWHNYIFHFSDITNIISILNSEKLYSRNKAIELNLMSNDNADDSVIANTGLNSKDFVRFYFGALTPTQYQNEGFKPKNTIVNNAHCPLPVFLLFDFVKLLSREDCYFSTGNIASPYANIYNDITSLNNLEFEYIYHRDYLSEDMNKRHIIYCRHAEVLIPYEIDIYDYIVGACVRSEAEKQTLIYHLSEEAKKKLKDRIVVSTIGLFNANKLYIDKVYLENDSIKVSFSRRTSNNYVFDIKLLNLDTGSTWEHNTGETILQSNIVAIPLSADFINYHLELEIYIDDNLAYKNSFVGSNGFVF